MDSGEFTLKWCSSNDMVGDYFTKPLQGDVFVKFRDIIKDNRSAILLESNGHWSRGKHSKHISVHYFFVKGRIQSGELSVKWCPATEMIGDFFMKPLQGPLFVTFRNIIMNLE